MATKQLKEFKADDQQSQIPEPIDTGNTHAKRGADRSGELPGKDSPTKVQALANAMSALAQCQTKEIDDVTAGLDKSKSKRSADQSGELPGTVSPTTVKPVTEADLEILFKGIELTEEQKAAAFTMFEAAVTLKVTPELVRLEEEFETRLTEAVEEIRVELTEDVNKYLSYVAEEWLNQNEVAVESNLAVGMAKSFMESIATLFSEHQIVLPEAVDVVTDLQARLDEANSRLADAVSTIADRDQALVEYEVADKFLELTEGLALTQVERLREVAEGIEYETVQEFETKFNVLKDALVEGKQIKKTSADILAEEFIDEEKIEEQAIVADPTVNAYAERLSRHLKS